MKRSCKRKIIVPYNYRKLVNLIFDESYVFTFNCTVQAYRYDIITYVNVSIVFKRWNLLSNNCFYFVPGISNDIVRYKIVSRVKLNKRDREFHRGTFVYELGSIIRGKIYRRKKYQWFVASPRCIEETFLRLCRFARGTLVFFSFRFSSPSPFSIGIPSMATIPFTDSLSYHFSFRFYVLSFHRQNTRRVSTRSIRDKLEAISMYVLTWKIISLRWFQYTKSWYGKLQVT